MTSVFPCSTKRLPEVVEVGVVEVESAEVDSAEAGAAEVGAAEAGAAGAGVVDVGSWGADSAEPGAELATDGLDSCDLDDLFL